MHFHRSICSLNPSLVSICSPPTFAPTTVPLFPMSMVPIYSFLGVFFMSARIGVPPFPPICAKLTEEVLYAHRRRTIIALCSDGVCCNGRANDTHMTNSTAFLFTSFSLFSPRTSPFYFHPSATIHEITEYIYECFFDDHFCAHNRLRRTPENSG
jgi:hypothetical protein